MARLVELPSSERGVPVRFLPFGVQSLVTSSAAMKYVSSRGTGSLESCPIKAVVASRKESPPLRTNRGELTFYAALKER